MAYLVSGDPNSMTGPEGSVTPGQMMTYGVEFENVGDAPAVGVYIKDVLDSSLDDGTLSVSNMYSLNFSSGIPISTSPANFQWSYDPASRTVTVFVGNSAPSAGGSFVLQAQLKGSTPPGTMITNQALIYFPNALQPLTPTNSIVSAVPLPSQVAYTGPSTGTYLNSISLTARIMAGGNPLAHQPVDFQFAATTAAAYSDSTGSSTATVVLSTTPGSYLLSVNYPGDGFLYLPSTATATITELQKSVILQEAFVVASPTVTVQLALTMTDGAGQPLTFQTQEPKTVYLEALLDTVTVIPITSALLSGTSVAFAFTIPPALKQSAPLRARFGGDAYYSAATSTGFLTLIKPADVLPPRTSLVIIPPKFAGAAGIYVSSATNFSFAAVDDKLTIGDGQGVGVAQTFYAVDSSSYTVFMGTFTISTEGSHVISFYSVDTAGNTEVARSSTVAVDLTPPVSTAAYSGPTVFIASGTIGTVGGPRFISTATFIAISAHDPVVDETASGVKEILYGIDGPPSSVFVSSFNAATGGQHVLNFQAVDNVGNMEALRQLDLSVDTAPPVTSISFNGPFLAQGACAAGSSTSALNCPAGIPNAQPGSAQVFIASTTLIALSASDPISGSVASGVLLTQYRIDGGPWIQYAGAFPLIGQGMHTLQIQSQDRVMNTEAIQTYAIVVDQTPPVTSISLGSPGITAFGLNIITSSSPISLSAVDPTTVGVAAGVGQITYRIDNGSPAIYISPFTLSQGMHTISYGSIDRVQNTELQKIMTVGVGDFITGGLSGVNSVTASGNVGITEIVESNGVVALSGNSLINGNVIAAMVKTSGQAKIMGAVTQGSMPLNPEPINIDAVVQLAQASNSNSSIPASFLSAGVLTVSGNKTLTLTTGTYLLQGLNISGGGTLIANGPVDLLIQGFIQISGGGQANVRGPASNLVVFAATSQGMTFSGGSQAVGTFYGPRGPLQMTGGAQMGGTLFAQSATLTGNIAAASGNSLPPQVGGVSRADVSSPDSPTSGSVSALGADPTFTLQDLYAFPNPAVGGSMPTIHVAVGIADQVTIRIFDISGREVHQVTLTNAPLVITDGSGSKYAYEYGWDSHVPSGTYIYTIDAQKAGASSIHKSGKFAVVR